MISSLTSACLVRHSIGVSHPFTTNSATVGIIHYPNYRANGPSSSTQLDGTGHRRQSPSTARTGAAAHRLAAYRDREPPRRESKSYTTRRPPGQRQPMQRRQEQQHVVDDNHTNGEQQKSSSLSQEDM